MNVFSPCRMPAMFMVALGVSLSFTGTNAQESHDHASDDHHDHEDHASPSSESVEQAISAPAEHADHPAMEVEHHESVETDTAVESHHPSEPMSNPEPETEHLHSTENDPGFEHDHATDHGDPDGPALTRSLGKLHPLVVHFPIALLLAAALREAIGMARGQTALAESTRYCLILGALGATVAAALGWLNAIGYETHATFAGIDVVRIHRWAGVSTAGFSLATLFIALRLVEWRAGFAFRLLLFVTAILVMAAGHFGAMLVFGIDYFTH